MNRKIYRQIAKKYKVSIGVVKNEMNAALNKHIKVPTVRLRRCLGKMQFRQSRNL